MDINDFIDADDHTEEWKEAFHKAILRGLEAIGLTAEGYAKGDCPVDTGLLRNSLTHVVDEAELAVYIGTNIEYAPYVECGTGIYYEGGRQGGWFYKDTEGKGHFTYGSRPRPFLKPAATEHKAEYTKIFQSSLKN